MSDELKLPPGYHLRPDLTPPVTTAERLDEERITVTNPELIGFSCQVQHSGSAGKPQSDEPGMIAFGMVMTEHGPLLLMQISHADGSTMSGVMQAPELEAFDHCYRQAVRMMALALPEGEA